MGPQLQFGIRARHSLDSNCQLLKHEPASCTSALLAHWIPSHRVTSFLGLLFSPRSQRKLAGRAVPSGTLGIASKADFGDSSGKCTNESLSRARETEVLKEPGVVLEHHAATSFHGCSLAHLYSVKVIEWTLNKSGFKPTAFKAP